MLNYKVYGSGEPVIILHGLFGMLDNWRTIAKRMEDDFQLILVDQRNHGKSFWSDAFNYKLLSEDLHELIHQLGLYNPNIIGHSMGGKTAIQFAHDYYNHVNKLIVVDIVTKESPKRHEEIFQAVLGLELEHIQSRKAADEALENFINSPSIRQFILKNLSRKTEGGYEWKANFQSLYENYDAIRGEIQLSHVVHTPTLFIRGSFSDYISLEDEDLLEKQFTDYCLETIEAGHWIHAERPKELEHLLRTFLTA